MRVDRWVTSDKHWKLVPAGKEVIPRAGMGAPKAEGPQVAAEDWRGGEQGAEREWGRSEGLQSPVGPWASATGQVGLIPLGPGRGVCDLTIDSKISQVLFRESGCRQSEDRGKGQGTIWVQL